MIWYREWYYEMYKGILLHFWRTCLRQRDKERQMDQRSDDGRPRTPLERIKAEHELFRSRILVGDEDEIDWSEDISPQQVGLRPVWCDSDGKLWMIVRDGDKIKLRRILTHVA